MKHGTSKEKRWRTATADSAHNARYSRLAYADQTEHAREYFLRPVYGKIGERTENKQLNKEGANL